jgi:hypothetical protein
MRVRFSKTPRTTVTAPAPTPDRLHIGSPAYGFKIKLARPAAPTQEPVPVDPVDPAPRVEITPEHLEQVHAARVHRELDRIMREHSIFKARADVLDPIVEMLSFSDDGVLENSAAVNKAVVDILKDRRDAVMTNESAKGF